MNKSFENIDFVAEEGRQDIYRWYEQRQRNYEGFRKSLNHFQIFAFNGQLLRSFFENFNLMVLLQMVLAGLITYACKKFNLVYDVNISMFISPIVFPLAFSINTDFQRKEKVLEYLSTFKSSAMMWTFCMRDWKNACAFDDAYMKAMRNKIKSLMFNLREFLLTDKLEHRQFIVRVIYEDLSDTNQINEKLRSSPMTSHGPLVAKAIHFVHMMCLSFERLRVIREYRSPRSIRSFTKILIFVLPMLLSPYYVYVGDKVKSNWVPYFISAMVAFVFTALQSVQDKLDDPFDGMSEDDIKLYTLDEWTLQSIEATEHRTYKIGRFQVSSKLRKKANMSNAELDQNTNYQFRFSSFISEIPTTTTPQIQTSAPQIPPNAYQSPWYFSEDKTRDGGSHCKVHPLWGVLNNINSTAAISPTGRIGCHENIHSRDSISDYDFSPIISNGLSSVKENATLLLEKDQQSKDSNCEMLTKSTTTAAVSKNNAYKTTRTQTLDMIETQISQADDASLFQSKAAENSKFLHLSLPRRDSVDLIEYLNIRRNSLSPLEATSVNNNLSPPSTPPRRDSADLIDTLNMHKNAVPHLEEKTNNNNLSSLLAPPRRDSADLIEHLNMRRNSFLITEGTTSSNNNNNLPLLPKKSPTKSIEFLNKTQNSLVRRSCSSRPLSRESVISKEYNGPHLVRETSIFLDDLLCNQQTISMAAETKSLRTHSNDIYTDGMQRQNSPSTTPLLEFSAEDEEAFYV